MTQTAIKPEVGMDVKVVNSQKNGGVYFGKISQILGEGLMIKSLGNEVLENFENCRIVQFREVANEHGDDHHAVI